MFGIFDSPDKAIMKRIPVHMAMEFNAVMSLVDVKLSHFPSTELTAARASIGSVWACNNAMSGKIALSDFDYRYIQNMGGNYSKRIDQERWNEVRSLIYELSEKGLIPLLGEAG